MRAGRAGPALSERRRLSHEPIPLFQISRFITSGSSVSVRRSISASCGLWRSSAVIPSRPLRISSGEFMAARTLAAAAASKSSLESACPMVLLSFRSSRVLTLAIGRKSTSSAYKYYITVFLSRL